MSGFGSIGEFAIGGFDPGGVEIFVPAQPVVVATRAPAVAGGVLVEPPVAAITAGLAAPVVETSATVDVPALPITVGTPAPVILGGAFVEVSNSATVPTGDAIGETAIGEDGSVTNFTVGSPRIQTMRRRPLVAAGKQILVPAEAIAVGFKAPDIGARTKPVRIQAIAS